MYNNKKIQCDVEIQRRMACLRSSGIFHGNEPKGIPLTMQLDFTRCSHLVVVSRVGAHFELIGKIYYLGKFEIGYRAIFRDVISATYRVTGNILYKGIEITACTHAARIDLTPAETKTNACLMSVSP